MQAQSAKIEAKRPRMQAQSLRERSDFEWKYTAWNLREQSHERQRERSKGVAQQDFSEVVRSDAQDT